MSSLLILLYPLQLSMSMETLLHVTNVAESWDPVFAFHSETTMETLRLFTADVFLAGNAGATLWTGPFTLASSNLDKNNCFAQRLG